MRSSRSALTWPVLVFIAVLAPFLVGGTTRWAEGIILGLLGLLLAIHPPKHSLGWGVNLILAGVVALALTQFLPAHWFHLPEWRVHGAPSVALRLPSTLTPQPWLTAESALSLIGGIAWLYLLCESQSRSVDPGPVLKAFCIGLAIFAGVSEVLFYTGTPWPFVDSLAQFGPFPNKNQTGHVLAIGSLLAIACIYDATRARRTKSVAWWLICAGVLLNGLVLSLSRGAIGVFCIGLIFWLGCICVLTRSRTWTVLGIGTMSFLLTAFVVFGGKMLDRFQASTGAAPEISQDLRWTIQRDALGMVMESPFPGIGVGNFHNVFGLFHRAMGDRDINIVHPESDWFWLLDELGWIGLALAVCGVVLFARRAIPFSREHENWHWRALGCAAGLMLVLHGLVDVAAHRMGSVFVALFAFSFAMKPDGFRKRSASGPWIFRSAGLVLFGVGAVWVVATEKQTLLPGSIGLALVKERAPQLNADGKYQDAIDLTTRALEWAPMDWELFYDRAVALAYLDEPRIDAAKADFARARFLQPITPELPLKEGIVWMVVDPSLTPPAWQEALRRAPDSRERLYAQMLAAAANYPLADSLRDLAGDDPRLRLEFFEHAPKQTGLDGIEQLLSADPDLKAFSAEQKKRLFSLWARIGVPAELAREINRHEEWLPIGWMFVSQAKAAEQDFESAYSVAHRFAELPAIPEAPADAISPAELSRRLYANSEDFAAAFALVMDARKRGAIDEALGVLRKAIAGGEAPLYFHRLRAELHAEKKEWQPAFEALMEAIPKDR